MDMKKLLPLYIGAAVGPMGGIGIITIIPVMADQWSIDFNTVSLAISFYMIPYIVIQLFSGSIAQLFDVRKTLFLGFAVYALGALLCGFSENVWVLFASRFIQGTGAAFLTPIIMALIGEIVPSHHVGKAIGFLGVAYTIGVTLGPSISGVLEVYYGWQGFFFFLAALNLSAGILYAISSEPVNLQKKQQEKWTAIFSIIKNAMMQPGVLFTSLAAFSFFVAYIGIMTFTASFLKFDLQLPSDRTGLLLSMTGFSGIIISPFAGYWGDKHGRRIVFWCGGGTALIGILLMAFIPFSYTLYLILFLIFGVGAATAWTSLNTMAVENSPQLRKPVTSVYNSFKFSGYALAPVILSFIYSPFGLTAVQVGCMVFICLSIFLTVLVDRPTTPT